MECDWSISILIWLLCQLLKLRNYWYVGLVDFLSLFVDVLFTTRPTTFKSRHQLIIKKKEIWILNRDVFIKAIVDQYCYYVSIGIVTNYKGWSRRHISLKIGNIYSLCLWSALRAGCGGTKSASAWRAAPRINLRDRQLTPAPTVCLRRRLDCFHSATHSSRSDR